MQEQLRILMFGPDLGAKSGISAVVNHWLEAGIADQIALDYVSTLDDYVPGNYAVKFANAIRSYARFVCKSFARIDVVHIHLSSGMSFYRKLPIFWYAKLRRFKVAVHLHGSEFKEFYADSNGFQKRLIAALFDHADAVLVLSSAWATFVRGISANEHIHTVYNGALPSKASVAGDGETEIVIAFMGRLGDRKGTFDLLEAFDLLVREAPEVRLVLGGDGEVEKVQSIVRDKGLADRVSVLGWVSGEDKDDVFARTDIYTLPSYNEGLPGSVLEAMACATPVVSTPVGGIPEAIIEGINGYLVEPGDVQSLYERLLELCRNKALRESMGREGRRLIEEKFNMRTIVGDLVDIYHGMLAPKSP